MKLHIFSFLFALVLATNSSGANLKMTSGADYDQFLNFSAFKTYAWSSNFSEGNSPVSHEDHALLHRLVEEEMAKKGFQKIDAAKADIVISYRVMEKQKTERVHYSYGRGERDWNERTYKHGTLILDFLAPGTNRIVWRGWVQAEILRKASDKTRFNRTKEAILKVIQHYPPK